MFATKDSTLRITDTLAFIGNTPVVTLAERQHAHQFVTAFINNVYPAVNAGQPAYEAFSQAMSLGWHLRADPNNFRQMKRAAYMLTAAIRHADGASIIRCRIDQISDAAAQTTFTDLLRKVRIVSDQQNARNTGATAARNELFNFPARFLATNRLVIFGSPVRDNTQGDQNILQFHLRYDTTIDRYVIAAGAAPVGGVGELMDSVAATQWTRVPNSWNALNNNGDFSQIPGIELASQLMITTQFTGCAFCMKRHGGQVYCAHLAPFRDPGAGAARGLTGTNLARELAGLNAPAVVAGDFANAAGGANPFAIYGAGFARNTLRDPGGYPSGLGGGGSYMTVVGVRRGADYQIYSQVTQNHRISGSYRVF